MISGRLVIYRDDGPGLGLPDDGPGAHSAREHLGAEWFRLEDGR